MSPYFACPPPRLFLPLRPLQRLIFDNLRKVIAYQIAAGCWSEFLPVLACFFFGMPQPLSSFLMIVISCVSGAYTSATWGCA
jgi:hypothetical protein